MPSRDIRQLVGRNCRFLQKLMDNKEGRARSSPMIILIKDILYLLTSLLKDTTDAADHWYIHLF